MTVYMTEEEQLENIRKWWRRHQQWITFALSCVLIVVAGYRYWNWHMEKKLGQASITYEQMLHASQKDEEANIQAYANRLVEEYSSTVYADAAHLVLAKLFIKQGQTSKAQAELSYVAEHSSVIDLKQLAQLRLARLFIADKRFDDALMQLTHLDNTPFIPLANELKGDVYVATGNYVKAEQFYHKALDNRREIGNDNLYLEMKANAISALIQTQRSGNPISQTV